MPFALCSVSAAPVRKEPAHRSETTTQLLFGETVEVLDEKEEWRHIRSLYDGYESWLTHHLITAINEETAKAPLQFVSTGLVNPVTLPDQLLNLPMGSSLTGFDEETRLLWDGQYKYHGTYRNIHTPFDSESIMRLVQVFLNAPYLWGGRTFMGVDCSGFVQVVFKVLGIPLLRDAWQQAGQGTEVLLEESRPGDLVFFQNKDGRIVHVGLLLGDGRIAHASGKVRVDQLTKEGIIHAEKSKQTHQLFSIRRYF